MSQEHTRNLGFGLVGSLCLGLVLALVWKPAGKARALPSAPGTFCATYGSSPLCSSGQTECTTCHSDTPPAMNPYGAQVKEALAPGQKRPLTHEVFSQSLKQALQKIESQDSDGDGVSNLKEIQAGYLPGDKNNTPSAIGSACNGQGKCAYDYLHAYKKVSLDFCGQMLTYAQVQAFDEVRDKAKAIKDLLDTCLDTPFWNGKDGVVWGLAHKKIRPSHFAKAGDDPGAFPIADYDDDYNLFVYTQIDNHDARDVLLAKYFVDRKDGAPTTYTVRLKETNTGGSSIYGAGQSIGKDKRAGMMTTRWTLSMITMFSKLPRGTAAQMYRAYLGLDISKREGLYPVRNEPADYDNKGVRAAGCKGCHQTLDALSYPFSRYNGLSFEAGSLNSYIPDRMTHFTRTDGARVALVPEAGYLLGKRVKDLLEWAKVGANSDQFAKATVMDYWQLLFGAKPTLPSERATYAKLWKDFKKAYQYSVERMLHALVQTEAYGAP